MCKAHISSKSSNIFHTIEECEMMALSKIGQDFGNGVDQKLTYACIFLARMWRLRMKDLSLFGSLFQLMSGDTSDIVSFIDKGESFNFYLQIRRQKLSKSNRRIKFDLLFAMLSNNY
jgi:hypothetical protein